MSATLAGHRPAPDPAAPDPPVPEPPGRRPPSHPPSGGMPLVDLRLMQVAVEQAANADDSGEITEKELIDQIAVLESLQHAIAALQADRVRAFARAHAHRVTTGPTATTVEPRELERSIVGQVALACRVSPAVARTTVRMARDLREGLDHVRTLFAAGELSTTATRAVVAATADLDREERAEVDRRLAGHQLPKLGLGRLRDLVRALAAEVSPTKFRARAAAARSGRRVTLRPGDDGMCWLTVHLPSEQGAACMAALQRAVNDLAVSCRGAVTRSTGQIQADTLVERVTGQVTAEKVNVEIQAILPVEALIDPDSQVPAVIPGLGPVPVELLLSSRAGRLAWRRLVTRDGIVVGGDSRQRGFTGALADLVKARDGHRCREPYCDAPIRHIDHIRRRADGGSTSLGNGRGSCAFHNYVREQAGWTVHRDDDGSTVTTTPTGHAYTSPTPRVA